MKKVKPEWLKNKGYLHLTAQIDINNNQQSLINKITNKKFVARHAFYPLIHSAIKERKYKKIPGTTLRSHSFKNEKGDTLSSAKNRPLHYSSHLDALIFGYYAHLLQKRYEALLDKEAELSKCVIAYRRIPILNSEKNKSTIHFAKEVFDEIKLKALDNCSVLMFDIKSFFSRINHSILYTAWTKLIDEKIMPLDHLNVFKATTKFSYILKDDLRITKNRLGKKSGFDEKKLSDIRKKGIFSFFASPKEFRDAIKDKQLKIYKYPFTKDKVPVGIPQGLPISAVLANLYLLEFDNLVYDKVVKQLNGFYRRYSDDILIVCSPEYAEELKLFIYECIKSSELEISKEKTEEFYFSKMLVGKNNYRINSAKINSSVCKIGLPLTYLGFEFYGEKVLIKSANLAKFYRRMIRAVKNKCSRAKKLNEISPDNKLAVYRNQLYKLYTIQDLNVTQIRTTVTKLVKTEKGHHQMKVIKIKRPLKSNYLSYIHRAASIMEDSSIQNQIRNHKRIFNESIFKQLQRKSKKDNF